MLVGDTLYLSGQGSRDLKTGQLPQGEIEAHTKQCLENIRLLLEAAGMGPANVVTANVYLTDMAMIGRMNEVYRTFFASEPPSRTTVGVPALPGDVPIEITFVATRSGKQVFASEGARPNANFSEVVAAGPMVYPAGKVGKGDGIEAHTKAALEGIGSALEKGGRSFSDVVEAKVYLTNLGRPGQGDVGLPEHLPQGPTRAHHHRGLEAGRHLDHRDHADRRRRGALNASIPDPEPQRVWRRENAARGSTIAGRGP